MLRRLLIPFVLALSSVFAAPVPVPGDAPGPWIACASAIPPSSP